MIQHRSEHRWSWFPLVLVVLALTSGCSDSRSASALPTLAPGASLSQAAGATTEDEMPAATARSSPPVVEPPSPTPIATAAMTAGSERLPTPVASITHTVVEGETLTDIAREYGITVDALVAANSIENEDRIPVGQELRVPYPGADPVNAQQSASTSAIPTVAPASTPLPPLDAYNPPAAEPTWAPSLISGDLDAGYPLVRYTPDRRMRIHTQPGTYPALYLDGLAPLIQSIFEEIQGEMGGRVGETADVYLAGTLFEINPALQGFSQSQRFRSFVLVNGAFHPGERNYILAHELSHIAATNLLGRASSTMIHEGVAVALPYHYLRDEAGYLPLAETCAIAYQDRDRSNAFRSARQLSQYNYEFGFNGHIRTYFNYHLSGCFVDFLLDNYGMDAFDRVYDSGAYSTVYGQTFSELDAGWQASLANVGVSVDSARFVDTVYEVAAAYERYVGASEDGVHANYPAYLTLNEARLALNRGELDEAQRKLAAYLQLMGE